MWHPEHGCLIQRVKIFLGTSEDRILKWRIGYKYGEGNRVAKGKKRSEPR